jgi:hypothetical protein
MAEDRRASVNAAAKIHTVVVHRIPKVRICQIGAAAKISWPHIRAGEKIRGTTVETPAKVRSSMAGNTVKISLRIVPGAGENRVTIEIAVAKNRRTAAVNIPKIGRGMVLEGAKICVLGENRAANINLFTE